MEIIKQYKIVIFIVAPILILVLIRVLGTNHFRTDARKLAEPSLSLTNIVTPDKVAHLEGDKLLINLGKDVIKHNLTGVIIKIIPPDSILLKENLKMLRRHEGPVLLSSAETSVSVRICMILSQMGLKNIFILTEDPQPEVLKYEFRPDTAVRPEL